MEFRPDDNPESEESNDDNNDDLTTEEGNEHLTEQHKRDNRVAWMKGTFQIVERVWEPETEDYVIEPHYPVHSFLRYVPENLFEDMAMYTNMYAIQNGMHLRPTSKSEIQTLIAHIISQNSNVLRSSY
ncbi:hypothetical protein QE152_g27838 [Popillia japonica]|uniref:PiggyBac transposable element-derived protein domain-containing protein n=1 Tax=Popillia japonica TaxID=7064 RepID=A0AAW1JKR2_POPJA